MFQFFYWIPSAIRFLDILFFEMECCMFQPSICEILLWKKYFSNHTSFIWRTIVGVNVKLLYFELRPEVDVWYKQSLCMQGRHMWFQYLNPLNLNLRFLHLCNIFLNIILGSRIKQKNGSAWGQKKAIFMIFSSFSLFGGAHQNIDLYVYLFVLQLNHCLSIDAHMHGKNVLTLSGVIFFLCPLMSRCLIIKFKVQKLRIW